MNENVPLLIGEEILVTNEEFFGPGCLKSCCFYTLETSPVLLIYGMNL